MKNNTNIIYKVTCTINNKVYVASSHYSDPKDAFIAYYICTQRNKEIKQESTISIFDLDLISYDINNFKVELLEDNIDTEDAYSIKMKYIKSIALQIGQDLLYNNTSNGNKIKFSDEYKLIGKHKYYVIVSKHYMVITIFEDRFSNILYQLNKKQGRYIEDSHNSITVSIEDTYDKAVKLIRKQLKIVTGITYQCKDIKRLCANERVAKVSDLPEPAITSFYNSNISSKEYSDLLDQHRYYQDQNSIQEIKNILGI